MPYKRPDPLKRNGKPHPIVEKDSHKHLHLNALPYFVDFRDLLDEGNFSLGQLTQTLARIKVSDWSEYKKASARAKQNEMIHSARQAMLSFFKRHIERSRDYLNRTRDQILGMSSPQIPKEANEAIVWSNRQREIRDILRGEEPKVRHALIERHGLPWLQACIDAPDDLVSPQFIEKMRRNYAFSIDPSLALKEEDAVMEYQAVRRTCADISAIASHMLIDQKYDPEESLSPVEFYDTFPPESDYDKQLVDTRIQNHQKKVMREETMKAIAVEKDKESQAASGLTLENAHAGNAE